MKKVATSTYTATIYIGTKIGYRGDVIPVSHAIKICQKYCDEVGLGLSFTLMDFIYTDGSEPGVAVGLINYPRFPSENDDIKSKALELAEMLLKELKQQRCTVVLTDETIMLEAE